MFQASVGGAALILMVASLASRVLGLLRDRLLATGFGAGADLDVYYAAFRIPDFIFQILILGAISAAFIPVFAGYLGIGKPKEASKVASSVLTIATAVLLVVTGLVWILAPQLMPFITPGFSDGQLDQAVMLTRIMLLSPIFFGLSGIFGSILNSYRRFIAYALAPLFYNLGIIIGALIAPHYGLYWLAVGVVIGAFLQMVVQLGGVLKTSFAFRLSFDLRHPGVRRIFILMVPTTVGLAVVQINLLVETIIATTLREGSLSQFFLATSLSMIPVGIVGTSFAISVFPVLAQAASRKQTEVFTSNLLSVIRQILFYVIPASVGMMLLRAQIVRLIYGAGKFDFTDTRFVTSLLGILAVSLFAQALIPLLTRAFYALRNTKTPVIISGVSMVVNIGLALLLTYYLGVIGLAIAFSAAAILQLGLLFFFLSAKVPALEDKPMIEATTKIVLASLIMGAAVYGTLYGVAFLAEGLARHQTVVYFLIQTLAAVVVGVVVYFYTAKKLGLPEAQHLLARFRRAKAKADLSIR